MDYTIDYFISKFEAIPEDKWVIGVVRTNDGRCCAMGHCGVTYSDNIGFGSDSYWVSTKEANALLKILGADIEGDEDSHSSDIWKLIYTINDATNNTPKKNILEHLRKLKNK